LSHGGFPAGTPGSRRALRNIRSQPLSILEL
jgi:hypothetical protein